jgi:hypothetical protein
MGEYREFLAIVGLLSISCGSLYLVYQGLVFWLWVKATLESHERVTEVFRERLSLMDRRVSNLERL